MLSIVLHPAVLIPWAILLFIPWNLYLRVGFALILFCALLTILFAGHHEDGLGKVILFFLMVMALLIWAAAGGCQYVLRRAIIGQWPTFQEHPTDRVFVWAAYALGALCVFLFAVFRAAGTAHVALIHLVLCVIAAASLRKPGFAITLGLLIGFSLYHPTIVKQAASEAANGAPHCIYLNARNAFAADWQDLTFLTMDKQDWNPHAYLVVQTDPPTYGYWSYRNQVFVMTGPTNFTNQTLSCPTD